MIQDDAHLLVVLRYIEANPVRARMVTNPADYRWSSYPCHGLRRDDPLLSPFPEWEELGRNRGRTSHAMAGPGAPAQSEPELKSVRGSLRSGRPFGTLDWTAEMARKLNIELDPRPRGRPRKEK